MKKLLSCLICLGLLCSLVQPISIEGADAVLTGYERIEAESGYDFAGGAAPENDANASGGKFVGYMSGEGAAFTVDYYSQAATEAQGIIYGATHTAMGNADYALVINGTQTIPITFVATTASWDNYTAVPFRLSLQAGNNTIQVKRLSSAANIDCIDISVTPNLALGKACTVSSVFPGFDVGGEYLTDGKMDTRWAAASGQTQESFEIDFGSATTFNTLILHTAFAGFPEQRVSAYRILYPDGDGWALAYENTTGIGVNGDNDVTAVASFATVTANKMRVELTQPPSYHGVTIWEAEVYHFLSSKIWDSETLAVTAASAGSITLAWDTPRGNYTKYVIYKDGSAVATVDKNAVTKGEDTSYYTLQTDGALSEATYTLQAVDYTDKETTDGPSVRFSVGNAAEILRITGDSMLAIPAEGETTVTYSVTARNDAGVEIQDFPAELRLSTALEGVSLVQNTLTVLSTAQEGSTTLQVAAGTVTKDLPLQIYHSRPTYVSILGASDVAIPSATQFSATVWDQAGNKLDTAATFSMEETVPGVSVTADGFLTVTEEAESRTIKLKAAAENKESEMNIHLNNELNLYKYFISNGGYATVNGQTYYNRPIYGSHIKDLAYGNEKFSAFLGDRPTALLTMTGGMGMYKRGHIFYGIEGGKWFDEFDYIKSTYIPGRMEYELRDSTVNGTIRLTFVRPVDFEGLLVHMELPEGFNGKVVSAFGGLKNTQFNENDTNIIKFAPSDTQGNKVTLGMNRFKVWRDNEAIAINGTSSAAFTYKICDGNAFGQPVDAFLASNGRTDNMVAGTQNGAEGDIYFVYTPDELSDTAVEAYLAEPAAVFAAAVDYFDEASDAVWTETPDPYLDLAVKAKTAAMDGIWNDPCFMHGAVTWHFPMVGWRSMYGGIVAGWHDRVAKQAAAFGALQVQTPEELTLPDVVSGVYTNGAAKGAIPYQLDMPNNFFYNMGENFIDQILYDYEWTGDLSFIEDNYQMISDFLLWEETALGRTTGDMLLYENKINEWNTDQKWCNGGYGTNATVFNYRANTLMIEIAKALGKDSTVFEERQQKIKKGIDSILWQPEEGVYAEYVDAIGNGLAHNAPDLSTITKPITDNYADMFQSYQLLRYSEYAIESLEGTPRDGLLTYSSNWLPNAWSTRGIYVPETTMYALALYRGGMADRADRILKGLEAGFHCGNAPGSSSEQQTADGASHGSTDFSDPTSTFLRMTVEGLFGIRMQANHGLVTITPAMPKDWDHAAVKADGICYRYTYGENTERFVIKTDKPLVYELNIPAKHSKIKSVTVNGEAAAYEVCPGVETGYIAVTTEAATGCTLEIVYDETSLPAVDYPQNVSETFTISAGAEAEIKEIYDPQGVLTSQTANLSGSTYTAQIGDKQGNATFFVLVEQNDICLWQPVDIVIKDRLTVENGSLTADGGTVYADFAVVNNTEAAFDETVVFSIGGQSFEKALAVGANEQTSVRLALDPAGLTPGNNTISIRGITEAELTNWALTADENAFEFVDLSAYYNQNLQNLHTNQYLSPRPNTYSDGMLLNGRPGWETVFGMIQDPVYVNTDVLNSQRGQWMTDAGVPFYINAGEQNAVFTSVYDNFPTAVTVPVGKVAKKAYFFLVCSTNANQSQLANAQITLHLADGKTETLALSNPENIDDWMGNQQSYSYAQSGVIQRLGANTHGNIVAVDLPQATYIESISLETLANEVLCGLLGITLVNVGDGPAIQLENGALYKGTEKIDRPEPGTLKLSFTAENTTSDEVPYRLIYATYQSGKLVKVTIDEATLDANQTLPVEKEIDNTGAADQIKVFGWWSEESMAPASNTLQFGD